MADFTPVGVTATVEGLSGFTRDIDKINKNIGSVSTQAEKTGGIVGKLGSALGTTAAVAGTAVVAGATAAGVAIAGIGIAGVKAAADMEQQVANIRSVFSGVAPEVEKVNDLILALGVDPGLKVSATEAARAIELLARNGLEWQQIADGAAKSSVLLANATGADFGTAADLATDVMAAFNIEVENMNEAVDGITSVIVNSKFSIDDYRLALSQGGGVAASVGVSFEDFNTTIAAIPSLFGSGSDAGTSFKVFLQRLVPQSNAAADKMRALGLFTGLTGSEFEKVSSKIEKTRNKIEELDPTSKNYQERLTKLQTELTTLEKSLVAGNSAFFDSQGNMRSMAEIAGVLDEAFSDLSDAQRIEAASTIFGTDSMRAAFALADVGEEKFRELQSTMGDTSAADSVAIRMDTLSGVMEILGGIWESMSIQIGNALLPSLRILADELLNLVSGNESMTVQFFEAIGKFLETTIPVAINFTKSAITNILIPAFNAVSEWWNNNKDIIIGGVNEIFGFIATTAQNIWQRVVPAVITAFNRISGWFSGAGAKVNTSANNIFGGLEDTMSVIQDETIPLLVEAFGNITKWFTDNDDKIKSIAENVMGAIQNAIELLFTPDGGVIGTLIENFNDIVKWFNDNEAAISTGVSRIIDIIVGITVVVKKVSDAFDDMWSLVVRPTMDLIKSAVGGLSTFLLSWADGDYQGAMDAISGAWDAIFGEDGSFITILKGLITVIPQMIGGFVDGIARFIDPNTEEGSKVIIDMWSGIWENAKTIITTWFKEILGLTHGSGFVTDLANKFDPVGAAKEIIDMWKAIWTNATTAITTFFTNTITDIGTFITDIVSEIDPVGSAKSVIDMWKAIWTNATTAITTFFTNTITDIGTFITDIVSEIDPVGSAKSVIDTWKAIWTNATTAITTFFTNVLEDISDFISDIAGAFSITGTASGILSNWDIIWDNITSALGNFILDISEDIRNFILSVADIIDPTGNASSVLTQWISIWDNAVSEFGIFVGNILNRIEVFIDDIISIFEDNLSDLTSIGKDMVNAIWDGFKSQVDRASEVVNALISGVKSVFEGEDVAGQLHGLGAAMIDGIIEGLRSKTEEFKDATLDLAKEALNVVRAFFGWNSPATLMIELGEDLVEGIIVGMENKTPDLLSTFETVSDKLFGNLTGFEGDMALAGAAIADAFIDPFVTTGAGALEASVFDKAIQLSKIAGSFRTFFDKEGILKGDKIDDLLAKTADVFSLVREQGLNVSDFLAPEDFNNTANVIDKIRDIMKGIVGQTREIAEEQLRNNVRYGDFLFQLKQGQIATEDVNKQISRIPDFLKGNEFDPLLTRLQEMDEMLALQQERLLSLGEIGDDFRQDILTRVSEKRAQLVEQILQAEQEITEILREQDKLGAQADFLSAQEDLINTILKEGLDVQQILGDIIFGEDLSAKDLLEAQVRLQKELINQQKERLSLTDEQIELQQKAMQLAEAERQLKFLEDQKQLLADIQAQGLDPTAILQGFQFGVEANQGDFLDALTRFTQAMISNVEEDLGIASPSKVFARIGSNLMGGLTQGIMQAMRFPQAAMQQAVSAVASPQTVQAPMVNRSQSNVFNTEINSQMDAAQFQAMLDRSLGNALA